MTLSTWEKELAQVMPRVLDIRRRLHRHPELSGQEAWTRQTIVSVLTALDVSCRFFEGCNGVMGVIENGPGRCLAIRADMDALPVTEATGLPFASENPGVMHACGHDAHMAIALGTAMWLTQNRDKWHGTAKLLFEPAEETDGGGQWMVEQGCMRSPTVDCVIGQHMNPHYDAGVFFSKPGYVSGASDEVLLSVTGKCCHGAYPESGTDAIVLASQVVCALQTLVSRNLSPLDSAVLTLGTVSGGKANNIVCGRVDFTGTLRTLREDTRAFLKDRIGQTACGVARALGGDAEVTFRPSYGAVYNDDGWYARFAPLAEEILGKERMVQREAPSLGVESFCYFLKETPGVYYDLGSGKGTALHTDTFLVDEACLLPAVALQCAIAQNVLG